MNIRARVEQLRRMSENEAKIHKYQLTSIKELNSLCKGYGYQIEYRGNKRQFLILRENILSK